MELILAEVFSRFFLVLKFLNSLEGGITIATTIGAALKIGKHYSDIKHGKDIETIRAKNAFELEQVKIEAQKEIKEWEVNRNIAAASALENQKTMNARVSDDRKRWQDNFQVLCDDTTNLVDNMSEFIDKIRSPENLNQRGLNEFRANILKITKKYREIENVFAMIQSRKNESRQALDEKSSAVLVTDCMERFLLLSSVIDTAYETLLLSPTRTNREIVKFLDVLNNGFAAHLAPGPDSHKLMIINSGNPMFLAGKEFAPVVKEMAIKVAMLELSSLLTDLKDHVRSGEIVIRDKPEHNNEYPTVEKRAG